MSYIVIALVLFFCLTVWFARVANRRKHEIDELKKKQEGRRKADEKIEQMYHGDALGNALDVLSNKR